MEIKPKPSIFCKNPDDLLFDEACLNVYSQGQKKQSHLYYQYNECHTCDYSNWTKLPQNGNTALLVKTTDLLKFRLDNHENDSCSQFYTFDQHGIYGWNITQSGCSDIYTIRTPENANSPLYIFIAIILLTLAVRLLTVLIRKSLWWATCRGRFTSTPIPSQDEAGTPTDDAAPLVASELIPAIRRLQQTRVISLDAFRGITIAFMVFVNYGGGQYWFFKHSPWNGLTVADLVFPWFAWIMGVGIALSVRSKLRSGMPRLTLLRKVLRRSVILLFLGMFISNFNKSDLRNFRIPGVLQRLGVSYFLVASIEAIFMERQPNFQYGRWVILQDVLDSWVQWVKISIIVLIHTAVTFILEVPDCPRGYLGPGGLADHHMFPNCTGGAAGFIDRQVFHNNMYQVPTSAHVYHSVVPFDPEGLLGALTTSLTVYLGVAAGRIILCSNSTGGRVKRWTIYAIILAVSGGCLCGWSKEDGLIPINKNLWSLSFVFVTASLAFCLLIFLYLIIDHWNYWSGEPFTPAGMNSILIYVGHEVVKKSYPFHLENISRKNHTFLFSQNLFGTALWITIAAVLYSKDVFITV